MSATGSSLSSRALRGSALTAGSFVITQGLRLASNLILTRLLFPEAFGLMALVSVVLVGLQMFSDTGIGPAISQSARGDDRRFLDTAWTINVIRGALLWLVACAAAWPLAILWQAPELKLILPVVGLTLLIAGFNPTRIDTANRHLLLGRLTVLDLAAQVVGILSMVGLALVWPSVWALVWGSIIGAVAKLLFTWIWLPGPANTLAWEPAAGSELLHFGKWIFLSSLCGFLLAQGDKAVLGRVLSLEGMGIYNIGFFLASFPALLAGAVVSRVMIPLYRDRLHAGTGEKERKLRKMRLTLTCIILVMLAAMAAAGKPLVGLLYDPRYAVSGLIVALVALAQMPGVIGMTYDQAALAAGNGRGYFTLLAARAGLQTLALVLGVQLWGPAGALIGQGLAAIIVHPLIVRLARQHGVWDARHDGICALLMVLLAAGVWAVVDLDVSSLTQLTK